MSRRFASAALTLTAAVTSIALAAPAWAGPASLPPAQTSSGGSFYVLADFGTDTGWQVDRHPRTLADITGDGRADIVGFGAAGVWTSVALGNGGFGPVRFVLPDFGYDVGWRVERHPRFVVDISGDGRADIVGIGEQFTYTSIANGDGTFGPVRAVPLFAVASDFAVTKYFAADVNGDGRVDLGRLSNDAQHELRTAVSQGDGTFGAALLATTAYDFANFDYNTFQLADVTGDRRAEVVALQVTGPIRMVVSRPIIDGTGRYTAPAPTGATFPPGAAPSVRLAGITDVTSDGRADLVAFGDSVAGTWVATSLGDGTFTPYQLGIDDFGPNLGWDPSRHPRLVIDITGDHNADLVGFGNAGVYTAVARGDGTFQPARFVNPDFGYDEGWRIELFPRTLADITGDGMADLVGFGSMGVFTVTARGDGSFNAPPPPPPPTTVAVPNLRGDTPAEAADALRGRGLVPGTRRTTVDPTCDFIGLVVRQSPAAGTQVSPGTVVDMWIGKAPSTNCS